MAKRKKTTFLRTDYHQYSKLGLRRKNKLKYRKGKGQGNKQRLKMKGHLRNVSIGFRGEKKTRGLVNGMIPVLIKNVENLKNLKQGHLGILSKMGGKKKIEIAEYAFKNSIKLGNLNAGKFIQKIEKQKEKKLERKSEKDKKEREEKAKEKEKEIKEEKKEETKASEEKKETELENVIKNTESDIKENVEEKK